MTEEGQVEVSQETAETPVMFDGDGKFTENWTHTLADTALHDNATLKTAKSVEALAAMTVSAQKMVGANKIAAPNEASTEAEWDAYFAAGGRPDTAADYAFAKPEELPDEYYNPEQAKAAQELMHKLGLSKKQADALFAFNNNYVMAQLAKNTQDAELAATELKDGLYADWGNAFEQKKHLGNVAVEQGTNGDVEFKARLTEKFGNDPDFIRFSANLGGKFTEASSIKAEMIPTPGDIQEKIDTEIASPAYGIDYAKHGFTKQQHQAAVKKVSQLFQEKVKHTKTG